MSRTKHTRPKGIIAGDRVKDPRGKRGANDLSTMRQFLRTLKHLGLAVENSPDLEELTTQSVTIACFPAVWKPSRQGPLYDSALKLLSDEQGKEVALEDY